MEQSTIFKLAGVGLSAWATLSNAHLDTKSFGILTVFILLIALLDAGNGMHQATQASDYTKRLFSLSGAPLYVALLVIVFIANEPLKHGNTAGEGGGSNISMCGAEGGGCGTKGGCGSVGCGSSSGGACGCGSGKKTTKTSKTTQTPQTTTRQLSQEELKKRTAEIQERAIKAGISSGLPGIGPNARPLPPGLIPKSGAVIPSVAGVPSSPPERAAPTSTVPDRATVSATSDTSAKSAQTTPTINKDESKSPELGGVDTPPTTAPRP